MPRLTQSCPHCESVLVLKETLRIGDERLNVYKCGHAFAGEIEGDRPLKLESVNRDKKARTYQQVGVDFIVNGAEGNEGGFNCIIGDQMRLGKTPQALLALASCYKERTPCLIIVRSANLRQWMREYKEWTDPLPLGIFPIIGSKTFIPPGFSAYVISMDTFSRNGMSDRLLAFGFKLCIVDEAHSFKNVDSKRSQSLIAFLKSINKADITKEVPFNCMFCGEKWNEQVTVRINGEEATQQIHATTHCPKCYAVAKQSAAAHIKVDRKCGVVLLTGTPIKNRADEYWVLLNIVAPSLFPSLASFRNNWLEPNAKGQYARVKSWRFEEFKRLIAPFVLRREKEDVYTDYPPLNIMYTVIEVEDQHLKEAYNRVLDSLEAQMVKNPNLTFFQSIGELTMLRQIAGMAKVNWAADYVREFCEEESDHAKIAIGIHHHGVRDGIKFQVKDYGVEVLDGTHSADRKDQIMREFEYNDKRVLVINELAGGVGMDFRYVDHVLQLERQWNGADEMQFLYRFYNPDRSLKDRPTNVENVLAKGTLDEWWHNMLVEKYGNLVYTLDSNWKIEEDQSSFRKLLEQTVANRL